jgi:hypothetical protein
MAARFTSAYGGINFFFNQPTNQREKGIPPAGRVARFAFGVLTTLASTSIARNTGVKGMRIMFINNEGGGFADFIELASGTTIGKLFQDKIGGKTCDYLIRVNRQPTNADYVLQENDRVSITPTKVEGARILQLHDGVPRQLAA